MAECRSSKPDAAGSIPVAHSNNSQRRVVSNGKMPVSKTEVFSSNLNVPAKTNFPVETGNFPQGKGRKTRFLPAPHTLLTIFTLRNASQIGAAAVLKTAAFNSAYGFKSCALPPILFKFGFVAQRN